MVVTRRQSVSPIPPVASRTSSSTGSSRSSKGKGMDKSSPLRDASADSSNVPPNGTPTKLPLEGLRQVEDIKFDDEMPSSQPKPTPTRSPTKSKSKSKFKKSAKIKKRSRNRGISAFDIIARLFLLWLTIYTLSVCPEDTQLRSPVCRALTEYRRVFLEPYIYPPIRMILDHPNIAPHIQRVQPYYAHAVELSTPLVRRGKREWRDRVIPQLHRLQLRARPYVLRVNQQYDATVGPYIRQVSSAILRCRTHTEPYILAAAVKSHRTWDTTKPYLMPLWREIKRVPRIVTVYIGRPLGQARRQWVDPHVTKIWDAVVEQGRPNATASSLKQVPYPSTSVTPSSTGTSEATSVENVSISIAAISMPIPEPTNQAAASASSVIFESVLGSSLSTPSASKSSTSSEAPSSTVLSTIADVMSDSSFKMDQFVPPPNPEQTDEGAASASSITHETEGLPSPSPDTFTDEVDDIEELEGFLSELNLDDDVPAQTEEPPPPPPPPVEERQETQEELEERVRRIENESAEQRAEIEARHIKWENDLAKVGKAQRKVVRTTLKRLREAAVDVARDPQGPVRAPIEVLVQEAERSLKSLKTYARKLASEDKPEKEKIKALETVVDKVDKKFGERVDITADAIREWWDKQTAQESIEMSNIAAAVTQVANKAQQDLGFDYTWLPGVTWEDWQRYHKLSLTATEFSELYAAMQNGTASNAPSNPLSDVMEAIQEEVDDMILGFEANLSRVKSSALDMFSAARSDTPAASATRNGAGEHAKVAASVTTGESATVPEVSIAPIDPSGAKKGKVVPPVILSRGAAEVREAASRAEKAQTEAAHAEL